MEGETQAVEPGEDTAAVAIRAVDREVVRAGALVADPEEDRRRSATNHIGPSCGLTLKWKTFNER